MTLMESSFCRQSSQTPNATLEEPPNYVIKDRLLKKWQQLRTENHEKLLGITNRIKNFEHCPDVDRAQEKANIFQQSLELEALIDLRTNLLIKQQVINRILFITHKHFNAGSDREFYVATIPKMATQEALSNEPNKMIWRFFNHLGHNLNYELPKDTPIEQYMVNFVRNYEFSTSSANPKNPLHLPPPTQLETRGPKLNNQQPQASKKQPETAKHLAQLQIPIPAEFKKMPYKNIRTTTTLVTDAFIGGKYRVGQKHQ